MKNKKKVIVGVSLFGAGLLVGLGVRGTVDSKMPIVEVSPVSVPIVERKCDLEERVTKRKPVEVSQESKKEVEVVATRDWSDLDITPEERVEIEAIMKSRGETQPPPQDWVDHVFRGKIKKARRHQNS